MADLKERLQLHTTWRDSHGELNDAPNEAAERISQLEQALERAGDQFAEYAEMHRAKLHDGTPTSEWLYVRRKVERNEQMAAMCREALGRK